MYRCDACGTDLMHMPQRRVSSTHARGTPVLDGDARLCVSCGDEALSHIGVELGEPLIDPCEIPGCTCAATALDAPVGDPLADGP